MINKIIEDSVNHLLSSNPEIEQRFAELEGKSMAIVLVNTPIEWLVRFTRQGISLSSDSIKSADCTISGSAIALTRYLKANKTNPSTNASLGVEIEGDLDFAHQVSILLRKLNIDWEEILSQFMGDFPANQFSNFLSKFRNDVSQSKQSAKQHLKYLIAKSVDQIVLQDEAEDFYQQIDQLSGDALSLEKLVTEIELRQGQAK